MFKREQAKKLINLNLSRGTAFTIKLFMSPAKTIKKDRKLAYLDTL